MRSIFRAPALGFLIAVGAAAVSVSTDTAAQMSSRPWLGVAMDAPSPGAGARIGHVVRGSPAYIAGLREGDRITSIAGAAILRPGDVVHAIATQAAGDSVELAIVHSGVPQVVHATLAPFPTQDQMMRMDLLGTFAPAWGSDLRVVSGSVPSTVAATRGRVVVLDFWATWCGPCRVSIPRLDDLHARYGAQGLSVVGISTEDPEDVAAFVRQMSIHYGVASDHEGRTTRAYGVVSLPSVVVIDRRGVVRDLAVGYDPGGDARLDATVRALLAEPAPTP